MGISMSDIRKWLKIMENVPPVILNQDPKTVMIRKDATVMIDPSKGGGTARYMHSTPQGAMLDIKGVTKELSQDNFTLPNRDYEDPYDNGSAWFHKNVNPNTVGTMNDKPEFRAGDMVKVDDVFGTAIGPGFGVFIAYSTDGKNCIISFDDRQILVPTLSVGSVQEQSAKDNFSQTDNDGNLSPMSLGSSNVNIKKEPAMDHRDEFSKWIATVEEALSIEGQPRVGQSHIEQPMDCECGAWDCPTCFPDPGLQTSNHHDGVCPTCGQGCDGHEGIEDIEVIPFNAGQSYEDASGMGAGGMAMEDPMDGSENLPMDDSVDEPMEEEPMDFQQAEKPKSGKGVKLGDIVHTKEFRKTGGQDSPLSYGDEIEEDTDGDSEQMVNSIMSMQNMGLSKDNQFYSEEDLQMYSPEDLKQCYDRVMGDVSNTPAQPSSAAQVQSPSMDQAQRRPQASANTPNYSESKHIKYATPSLFEQIKWDEEIKEAFLDESSLSRLIGKDKGGQKLVQWLHRKHKLDNDADLSPAPFSERLLWKEYKRNPDNFIIVAGTDGVAGIKPYEKHIRDKTAAAQKKGKNYDPGGDSTLPYQVIAFTDAGDQIDPKLLQPADKEGDAEKYSDPTVMKARMGLHHGREMQNPDNVFNLLADQIGSLRTVYVTGSATVDDKEVPFQKGAVPRDKMAGRAAMKAPAGGMPEEQSVTTILKRIHPVLTTVGNQSVSQINKTAQRYMDAGDFENAQKIAANGQKLKQFLATLDTTGADNPTITSALEQAAGAKRGTPEFQRWASDVAKGNSSELKPILDALRSTLVKLT